MNQEEPGKKMAQLIARCWADEGFKRKLLADPVTTLKSEGYDLPAGLSIMTLENTDKLFHLVIPAKPDGLSDEDLAQVAGGLTAVNRLPTGTTLNLTEEQARAYAYLRYGPFG